MKVVWSKQAGKSMRQISSYIKKRFGLRAKETFLSEVTDIVSSLENNPYIGKRDPYMEGNPVEYRCMFVNRLSKMVYYVDKNNVYVVAFCDARRDPESIAASIESI